MFLNSSIELFKNILEDYNDLKKESHVNTKNLKKEERDVTLKLTVIDKMNPKN